MSTATTIKEKLLFKNTQIKTIELKTQWIFFIYHNLQNFDKSERDWIKIKEILELRESVDNWQLKHVDNSMKVNRKYFLDSTE